MQGCTREGRAQRGPATTATPAMPKRLRLPAAANDQLVGPARSSPRERLRFATQLSQAMFVADDRRES